jgi:hypothetical protein
MSKTPTEIASEADGGDAFANVYQRGMRLRDWLAGQALTGLLADGVGVLNVGRDVERVARLAYQFADAMLAARKPTPLAPIDSDAAE